MLYSSLLRPFVCVLAIGSLAGCSSLFSSKAKPAAAPASTANAPAAASATPKAPAAASASITPAQLHGVWECTFQIKMGEDAASFTYTNQFKQDGSVKSQAYLVYDMPSSQLQYSFVVQGTGQWRVAGNTVTLIVPDVVQQDRSAHKNPDMVKDKDLVPEDMSDTWTVQAHQGKNMRVIAGSLADEMLCQKE